MLMNCHYRSTALNRLTKLTVLIPTPEEEGVPIGKDFPVLYLLHGMHGDETSWLHYSNVQRYAQDAGFALVMPSVGNSFYQDMAHGEAFFTFMTQELPQVVQSLFPVSRKREDTFIAGLSMGGYGAWYLALRCPQLYAAAASLSGAVDIGFRVTPMVHDERAPKTFFAENCFGDLRKVPGSDSDLIALYPRTAAAGLVPRLYQSCGTKDYLYYMNKLTHEKLLELGAKITYYEIPGMEHEWDCWDQEIRRVLKWFREESEKV